MRSPWKLDAHLLSLVTFNSSGRIVTMKSGGSFRQGGHLGSKSPPSSSCYPQAVGVNLTKLVRHQGGPGQWREVQNSTSTTLAKDMGGVRPTMWVERNETGVAVSPSRTCLGASRMRVSSRAACCPPSGRRDTPMRAGQDPASRRIEP